MGKSSVVRIGKTRSNSVTSLHGRGVFVDCFGDDGCLGTIILGCFATTFFGGSTAGPFGLGVMAGKSVCWSTVDPFSEIGDEEGVLDVCEGREGLDFGIWGVLVIGMEEILGNLPITSSQSTRFWSYSSSGLGLSSRLRIGTAMVSSPPCLR